jgi:uncharacterized membrane protein YeaQ/YmgE (transglycosylase-associated protein family)
MFIIGGIDRGPRQAKPRAGVWRVVALHRATEVPLLETLLGWIVIGGATGWLACLVVRGAGHGLLVDVAVGIVGALLGSFLLAKLLGGLGFRGLNLPSFLGACSLLLLLRLVTRGVGRTTSL